MRRHSAFLRGVRQYLTQDVTPRRQRKELTQLPDSLLMQIPQKETRARSYVIRWFTEYVKGLHATMDLEEIARRIRTLNLQREFWDSLRSEAEARHHAYRLGDTISAREDQERRDDEYGDASHETRMLEERAKQAELRKQIEELSAPPKSPADDTLKDETIRDQIRRLLENLTDLVGAELEIERVAKANAEAAKSRGADDPQQQRIFRRIHNLGMQMLEELARERGRRSPGGHTR